VVLQPAHPAQILSEQQRIVAGFHPIHDVIKAVLAMGREEQVDLTARVIIGKNVRSTGRQAMLLGVQIRKQFTKPSTASLPMLLLRADGTFSKIQVCVYSCTQVVASNSRGRPDKLAIQIRLNLRANLRRLTIIQYDRASVPFANRPSVRQRCVVFQQRQAAQKAVVGQLGAVGTQPFFPPVALSLHVLKNSLISLPQTPQGSAANILKLTEPKSSNHNHVFCVSSALVV